MAKKKEDKAEATPTSTSNFYVVYCKLPNGFSFPLPGNRKLILNGSNQRSQEGSTLTIVGYGRTKVPIADWEYVFSVYSGLKVFDENNPIIFAAENAEEGDDMAREFGPTTKHGMEQRDPKHIVQTAEREAGNPQPKE